MSSTIVSDLSEAECNKCHKQLDFGEDGVQAECCNRIFWAEEAIIIDWMPKK